jgi:hypothetical protein
MRASEELIEEIRRLRRLTQIEDQAFVIEAPAAEIQRQGLYES